ncbi:hypothetical protein [Streptomyces sp. NPDC001250]|uniref:hypothetical protein n=1 Tax=unclassified Streptomyces TaxID=2593676 RepID=UPI003316F2F8
MASVLDRGMTAVLVLAALVVTASCQGGGAPTNHTTTQPTSAASTTTNETTTPSPGGNHQHGTIDVFPGRGSEHESAPAISLSASQVGEPVTATLTVHNGTGVPQPLQNFAAPGTEDTGTTTITDDPCSGTTLRPGDNCDVVVEHTASQPGPYTANLVMTTPEGTVTIPVTGEAVEPTTISSGTATPTPSATETTTPAPITTSPSAGLT